MNKTNKKTKKTKITKKKTMKMNKKIMKMNKKTNGGGIASRAAGKVVDFVKPGARASALAGSVADTGRSAIKSILTMENPIVYAYQVIERNVFGWDTIEQERKMGKTVKSIVGDKFEKKNKDYSLLQWVKGKKYIPKPEPPKIT